MAWNKWGCNCIGVKKARAILTSMVQNDVLVLNRPRYRATCSFVWCTGALRWGHDSSFRIQGKSQEMFWVSTYAEERNKMKSLNFWGIIQSYHHALKLAHAAHCFARQENGRQRVKRGWDHVCHAWRVLAQACGWWCVCAGCGVRFRLAVADFSLCVADVCVFLLPQHASVASAKKMTQCSTREGNVVMCLYFLF